MDNPNQPPSHISSLCHPPSSSSSTRWWTKETTAVVTGANRGIGFSLAKKLAEEGLRVILTSRDMSNGLKAVESLKRQGFDNVQFSLLDVCNASSISAFVAWFKVKYGVLDILVNNAAVSFNNVYENSVEHAETVIKTNFYGAKCLLEALLPFFHVSSSKSRIINITSRLGSLNNLKNQRIQEMLLDDERLTEERIDQVVSLFLEHVKEGSWKEEGWPETWTDYSVSKLALNAYSRMLAKRLQGTNLCINCYCPGFTRTGMTGGKGSRTPDVAGTVVATLVLLPPERLQTGKLYIGENVFLQSKF